MSAVLSDIQSHRTAAVEHPVEPRRRDGYLQSDHLLVEPVAFQQLLQSRPKHQCSPYRGCFPTPGQMIAISVSYVQAISRAKSDAIALQMQTTIRYLLVLRTRSATLTARWIN